MARAQQMWPTSLTWSSEFTALSQPQQGLVYKIWLSAKLDAAGFHDLWLGKWARSSTPQATTAEMRQLIDRLTQVGWTAVDYDTEELLLVPYIRYDAATQPQWYVAACRAVQTTQSAVLRRRAWEQIQIVHPPHFKSEGKRDTKQMVQDAYDDLYVFMDRHGGDPDRSPTPTPSPSLAPSLSPGLREAIGKPSGSLRDTLGGESPW
ncbi:hypothetical protein ACKUVQ_00310 [Mycobacterium seoulense]|uniref:hypothetical protein n=1 Tax=Mycobacterium seoulense TaxID=386911 RepID=UPI003CF03B84